MAQKPGQTVESTREILKTEKKTARAHLSGLTEINTLAVGEMISNTGWVCTTMSKTKAKNRESGLTARDKSGCENPIYV